LLVENVSLRDVLVRTRDASLCLVISQKLQCRLERLQVLSSDEDDVFATVLGDLNSLMSGRDLFGDLREMCLDLGQRSCRDEPEL